MLQDMDLGGGRAAAADALMEVARARAKRALAALQETQPGEHLKVMAQSDAFLMRWVGEAADEGDGAAPISLKAIAKILVAAEKIRADGGADADARDRTRGMLALVKAIQASFSAAGGREEPGAPGAPGATGGPREPGPGAAGARR